MPETVLKNGVTVISRPLARLRSCALGLWLENGVRHQADGQDGFAHLLEHLLLRDESLQLRFEAMGGQINAETGRELTALYGLVPAVHAYELAELFGACLCDLHLSRPEFEAEKQVVLRERASAMSSPLECIEEQALGLAWRDHSLGWPILGADTALAGADWTALNAYLKMVRVGRRLAVVAVGNIDHATLIEACERLLALPEGVRPVHTAPSFHPNRYVAAASGQVYLQWLMPAPTVGSSCYTAVLVAHHIVAGGMASRLYRELRQRRGWVYLLHGDLEFFSDAALWKLQLACDAKFLDRCEAQVQQVLTDVIAEGPTASELDLAKRHLAARLVLADDDASSLMRRLAREHFYLGRHPSIDEYLAMLSDVDAATVRELIVEAWRNRLTVVADGGEL